MFVNWSKLILEDLALHDIETRSRFALLLINLRLKKKKKTNIFSSFVKYTVYQKCWKILRHCSNVRFKNFQLIQALYRLLVLYLFDYLCSFKVKLLFNFFSQQFILACYFFTGFIMRFFLIFIFSIWKSEMCNFFLNSQKFVLQVHFFFKSCISSFICNNSNYKLIPDKLIRYRIL